MQGEFKQCPNGHYYQGATCPYCKTNNQAGRSTSLKTEAFLTDNPSYGATSRPTDNPYGSSSGTKTTIDDSMETSVYRKTPKTSHSRTVFGDEEDIDNVSKSSDGIKREPRYGRKLVGWLVTYSLDELGVDYKLYEGRNIIGRDMDCNITINDGRISGKHAVLLFRANRYSLTDSQSSHGTFVNDEDIELEPRYLNDGDIIRVGNTILKFRTSI